MAQILPFDIIHAIARQNRLSSWQQQMLATHLVYDGLQLCTDHGMDVSPQIKQINAAVAPSKEAL